MGQSLVAVDVVVAVHQANRRMLKRGDDWEARLLGNSRRRLVESALVRGSLSA